MALVLLLAAALAYLLAHVARADAGPVAAAVPLAVHSHPAGAALWLDGHERGTTPLDLQVEPGVHTVALKQQNALEQQYAVDVGATGAALDVGLWRRQPVVSRLRPALPGASLEDARFLEDGALGLSIALPPGNTLEAWRLDPASGALEQMLPAVSGSRLAFAPDGRHLAYLGREPGPPGNARATGSSEPPPDVVWLMSAEPGGAVPVAGWRAPLEPNEHLVDVGWTPDAQHLLAVATQPLTGGQARSRGWLLDADGEQARPLLDIPSEIVPGSQAWSPDGGHVAFVAHAQQINALCLLGLDGSFRYVADLDASSEQPLAYSGASWSADSQRLLFVAPHQHVPGVAFDWLASETEHGVYTASVDQPTPVGLADTRQEQVTWREDGQVLGLWRGTADGPLHIRVSERGAGMGQDVVELPLRPGEHYAAEWDLARSHVLIASRTPAASTDYWLARLGVDEPP